MIVTYHKVKLLSYFASSTWELTDTLYEDMMEFSRTVGRKYHVNMLDLMDEY